MGLRLDRERFLRELHRRGATAATLACAAHISPNTVTRCLSGAPISQRTLRGIVAALMALPILEGADALLATDMTRNAAAAQAAALAEDADASTNPST
ncbi:MAG: hypothetical protein DLM65_08480 [Candidatus Aeolococcus gillhamiae]|uniref:HTH cro/C1-type domain-containing protein n=1 Tax=Candidatus Aeolococcus gillhamiae TaxID=3127015 RepID=A0A2W5ZBS4_9BACT|nr:MAG: hypothetical protein DLM65_08480 [Candidatus Dormibacter sp. RRmetagenome_bin12]